MGKGKTLGYDKSRLYNKWNKKYQTDDATMTIFSTFSSDEDSFYIW